MLLGARASRAGPVTSAPSAASDKSYGKRYNPFAEGRKPEQRLDDGDETPTVLEPTQDAFYSKLKSHGPKKKAHPSPIGCKTRPCARWPGVHVSRRPADPAHVCTSACDAPLSVCFWHSTQLTSAFRARVSDRGRIVRSAWVGSARAPSAGFREAAAAACTDRRPLRAGART